MLKEHDLVPVSVEVFGCFAFAELALMSFWILHDLFLNRNLH